MIYFIIVYLLSAAIPLVLLNYDVFVKKQSITYGQYLGLTCLFLIPLVNFVTSLSVISWFLSKSRLFQRTSEFLDRNIN